MGQLYTICTQMGRLETNPGRTYGVRVGLAVKRSGATRTAEVA
jgi:hypothetical protein